MAFSHVPSESPTQINKAGEILVQGTADQGTLANAIDLVDRFRASHAYPINTFQATLRQKIKSYGKDAFVAQRLKRMPTIVDKLKNRHPGMKLTRMNDIGGVRAVVRGIADVYRLATVYKNKSHFRHEFKKEYDYIAQPRDSDGYRSLHLVYKYKNIKVPEYNSLLVELQIRTKLQHLWATAVETMGTLLGQALKSRQGNQEWLDFFAIVSSAFAYIEKCPLVPRFKDLSITETNKEVARAEEELRALEKMRGISVAVNAIGKPERTQKAWGYHLVVLDSLNKRVSVHYYTKNEFDRATNDYARFEGRAAAGEKIEPVLVSAGNVNMVRRAYPNFFLDIGEFADIVKTIVKTSA